MDTAAVETHIRTVAEAEIRPRFRSLADGEITTKTGPNDLVTVADVAAERALTPLLREVSDAPVLGEEATSDDASVLDRALAADAAWTVDPIDGTYNFVHGNPKYGVMVGYAVDGIATHGWIYHPETGDMFTGVQGAGAFINGVAVRADAPTSLADVRALVAPRAVDTTGLAGVIEGVVPSNMSAAWDYIDILRGDVDVLFYTRSYAWDHIPGTVMVREAGWRVAHLDGSDYGLRSPNEAILAAPTELWDEVRDVFLGLPGVV